MRRTYLSYGFQSTRIFPEYENKTHILVLCVLFIWYKWSKTGYKYALQWPKKSNQRILSNDKRIHSNHTNQLQWCMIKNGVQVSTPRQALVFWRPLPQRGFPTLEYAGHCSFILGPGARNCRVNASYICIVWHVACNVWWLTTHSRVTFCMHICDVTLFVCIVSHGPCSMRECHYVTFLIHF